MTRSPQPNLFQSVDGFLDEETCRRIRRAIDAGEKEAAEVLTSDFELQEAVRRVSSVEVDQSTVDLVEQHLDDWRPHAARLFGQALQSREGVGFMRYDAGGFYRRHRDRAVVASWPGAARRSIAVVVFLNSSRDVDPSGAFDGGILRLFNEEGEQIPFVDVHPRGGTLVAFPATRLHEVTLVENGTRDAVVDWFY